MRWNRKRIWRALRIIGVLFSPKTLALQRKPVQWPDLGIYYINLDDAVERNRHMEEHLKRLGLSYIRFPAVRPDPARLHRSFAPYADLELVEWLHSPRKAKERIGVVGLYLSHRMVMDSIPRRDGFTLLLEDDVLFRGKAFFHRIQRLLHRDDGFPDFDIMLFDCVGFYKKEDRVARGLYRPSAGYPHYMGTHAVLIRNAGLDRIRQCLDSKPIENIDNLYLDPSTGLNTLVYQSLLCTTAPVAMNSSIRS